VEKVRIYYDTVGRTLCVWFGEPESEDVCKEADNDTILMKDAKGRIIGFEKLNVELDPDAPGFTIEVVTHLGRAA
jgi:uncharacterized protein YuzE